jgi:hypothetical protein
VSGPGVFPHRRGTLVVATPVAHPVAHLMASMAL